MSKGLEAFNKFCDSVNACINSGGITNVDLIAKEQVEKELKALDIILEKPVQISWFTSLLKNFPNYTHHEYNFALPDNMQLMQEEYEILKEVLK